MDFAAPHAGFVIASYAITLIVLLALAAWTVLRARRLAREATDLEMRNPKGVQP